jgi:hypothetical protein
LLKNQTEKRAAGVLRVLQVLGREVLEKVSGWKTSITGIL